MQHRALLNLVDVAFTTGATPDDHARAQQACRVLLTALDASDPASETNETPHVRAVEADESSERATSEARNAPKAAPASTSSPTSSTSGRPDILETAIAWMQAQLAKRGEELPESSASGFDVPFVPLRR